MSSDATSRTVDAGRAVMGSVDDDGHVRRFVLADLDAEDDEAWVAIRYEQTRSLDDWR